MDSEKEIIIYFDLGGLPNAKLLLIVKDPIGSQKQQIYYTTPSAFMVLFSSNCFWFCSFFNRGENYEVKSVLALNFTITIIFRRNRPKINEFLTEKLGGEVLSKYWFKLGKDINSRSTDYDKFPIRESMFKNSNYLEIWNQLTSYYDKVRSMVE